MYNKIASIILNSAKAAGLSDVFVAQPDAVKENLAGKVFLLAEIGGKKAEGRKIFDFLILALNDNYYNDEKILFRDKVEGLKLENIFEAAIAKTNKDLAGFLSDEKIRINPDSTSITIGVIYENKLHFANFGRNRALLIYRHGENYELINVEANAAEAGDSLNAGEAGAAKSPQLFSSVISGEVPVGSYFIFASEALPEYLSGQEMIHIVTKLPPMTAAEQIKNVLTKINTYVPFLGIIVKNTAGLPLTETREELLESSSAHSSISSLNYTEQKTEQMLAPAGLINFSKIFRKIKSLVAGWLVPALPTGRSESPATAPVDLGTVKSLHSARADSFLIKEKIFFKRKSGWLFGGLRKVGVVLLDWLNPRLWPTLGKNFKAWLSGLSRQNRILFTALGVLVLVFIGSTYFTSWNHQRKIEEDNYNHLVATFEEKETIINSRLLYNDEAGAGLALLEAQALLETLPRNNEDQIAAYEGLAGRLRENEEKIQKIVRAEAAAVNDLNGLGVSNLVYAAGKLYAAGGDKIWEITPNASSSPSTTISGAELSNPFFAGDNLIYYWNQGRVTQFNIQSKANNLITFPTGAALPEMTSYKLYSRYFYTIAKAENQIYRYNRSGTAIGAKTDWLSEAADLSRASDFYVDGNIYVLNNDGQVLKFYLNKAADFKSAPLAPAMTQASKIIAGANNIYVFEGSSKRLAVLAKSDGHLIGQYLVGSLNDPTDVAVDEAGKAAYFLDGEKIYRISLE